MGFISTVTVNNDFLHDLPKVSNLGRRLYEAVSKLQISRPVPLDGYIGVTAIESHHADYAQPILIGGGVEAMVIEGISISYMDMDPEIGLLRQLAEKHGFVIYKSPPPDVRKRRK